MQILSMARTGSGFRGCLVDQGRYRFFHLSVKGRLRWLKAYAVEAFEGHDHFLAVMLKYLLPAAIFLPPVEIGELTPAVLDRLLRRAAESKGG